MSGVTIFSFNVVLMKIVIQRVKKASVKIAQGETRRIKKGMVIFLAFKKTDTKDTVKKIVEQIISLHLFPSAKQNMSRSILEEKGEILLVSQITLGANFSQGGRPDFSQVASFQKAQSLYNDFLLLLQAKSPSKVASGEFGMMMEVCLINDGPVTVAFEGN